MISDEAAGPHASADDGAAPPDWDSLEREVLCPLCEYNLRGLSEARCPECGHRSSWAELLAVTEEQPWFFETAKRRKLAALVKTWVLSLAPVQFWKRVRPQQRPRLLRLMVYLLASWLFTLLFGIHTYLHVYVKQMEHVYWIHPNTINWGRVRPVSYPSFPWDPTLLDPNLRWQFEIEVFSAVAMALWPLLTIATLAIFQQSLRRAQINPGHVLRAAIYSSDVNVLLTIGLSTWIWRLPMTWTFYRGQTLMLNPRIFWPILAVTIVVTYRLWTAYRLYMRFPHALATAIASQVIVALVLYMAAFFFVVV
jgi:hypothetical protein